MKTRPSCPQCDADPSDDAILMHSGVGNDHKGFVHYAWGQMRAQLTPTETRKLGLEMLECAEAAETDSMVFRLLTDRVGLDHPRAVRIIGELRHFRDDRYKEKES